MQVVNHQNNLNVQSSGGRIGLRQSVIAETLNDQLVRLDTNQHVNGVVYFKTLWVTVLKLLFALLREQTLNAIEAVRGKEVSRG